MSESSSARPNVDLSAGAKVLFALALAVIVLVIGSPRCDAPWIQGDEHSFIARNSDVTGEGRSEPFWQRLATIFAKPHLDLYQPVPILTYAIEAGLWTENRHIAMRVTDVLIHVVNAVLVWLVLARLLRRFSRAGPSLDGTDLRPITLLTWTLALLWAVHPTLTPAFTADMGRTHLLSATFALLSLLAHLRAIESGRNGPFGVAAILLVLAMMSKPIAGWFLIVFAVEAVHLGFTPAIRSWRVYVVAAICVIFALLTLATTRAENMLNDAELALFGDPITRSLVGTWYYFRDILWPVGLATWYPPDTQTGWGYWAAWAGLGILILSAALAVLAMRRGAGTAAVGIVWFWAAILPVLGLVGARVAAAQDRYLYLPLIGLLLAIGVWLCRAMLGAANRAAAARLAAGAPLVLAIFCIPVAYELAAACRSTYDRAERIVLCDPADPRGQEMLAMAVEFEGRKHAATADDRLGGALQKAFSDQLAETLRAAEEPPSGREYFKDGQDRAMFHFRIAKQLFGLGDFEGSLAQANRAAEFAPDDQLVLMQLAHCHWKLKRIDEASKQYARLEIIMPRRASDKPENRDFRAKRYTEIGSLLLDTYEDPAAAKPRFQKAIDADPGLLPARIGLAKCEILAGEGAVGRAELGNVLAMEPGNLDARTALGLYLARSHDWHAAYDEYAAVLRAAPTHYEALRGFHGVCAELDRLRDSAAAWGLAFDVDQGNEVFRSFFIFAAACTQLEQADALADEWLHVRPDNRLACLAKMLIAARAGRYEAAIDWAKRAPNGEAYPRAKELARGEAQLRLFQQRGQLGPEATVLRAALLKGQGAQAAGDKLLREFIAGNPSSPTRAAAEELLAATSSAPAVSP